MTASPDHRGRYSGTISYELATCVDDLSRLERSFARKTAPDRPYSNDKAFQRHAAARRLVRLGHDTERRLRGCDAAVEHRDEDNSYTGVCELPAGHTGAHDDPPRPAGERLCIQARELAGTAERVTHLLGWLAPTLDQRRAAHHGFPPEHRDALRDVAAILDRLANDAAHLAGQPRDTRVAPSRPKDWCSTDRPGSFRSARQRPVVVDRSVNPDPLAHRRPGFESSCRPRPKGRPR